jgi:hypothetical protein
MTGPVTRRELVRSLEDRINLLIESQDVKEARETMARTVAQTIDLLIDVAFRERLSNYALREDISLKTYQELDRAKETRTTVEEGSSEEGTQRGA